MKKRAFIFLIIVCVAYINVVFAATIELKNGRSIIGDIVRETEDVVVISKERGNFIYSISRDEVRSIRGSTPEEIERRKTQEAETYLIDGKKTDRIAKVKFSENRFGVVNAILNGKVKVPLLVDTGASLVVISEKTADKLGIDKTTEDKRISVVLADGSMTTAIPVRLDSVEVGGLRVRNVNAAILSTPPESDIDGLLGTAFLRYFYVKLDSKRNCMVLERN